MGRGRVREAGHALEQDVAVADQSDHEAIEELFLADDDAGHLLTERLSPGGCLLHAILHFADGGIFAGAIPLARGRSPTRGRHSVFLRREIGEPPRWRGFRFGQGAPGGGGGLIHERSGVSQKMGGAVVWLVVAGG